MGMVTDYEGCALVPFVIRGSLGPLGVLARPGKEIFYEIPFETFQERRGLAHTERYLQATDFGQPGGLFGGVSRREIYGWPLQFQAGYEKRETARSEILHSEAEGVALR